MNGTVVGVGIDLVEVARLDALLCRFPTVTGRIFTPAEIADTTGRPDSLSARFAAKEAVAKVLGGLHQVQLCDIEVISGADGAPHLTLYGRTASRAAACGVGGWKVSLTHDGGMAAAVVLAFAA